ncbi:MAG: hypothetical protein M3Z01_02390 [Thermoproteota archaeon]|nr:hypothetical protein [Thermoproteota archaeon]
MEDKKDNLEKENINSKAESTESIDHHNELESDKDNDSTDYNIQILDELKSIRKVSKNILKTLKKMNN